MLAHPWLRSIALILGGFLVSCAAPTPAAEDATSGDDAAAVTTKPTVSAAKAQFLTSFAPVVAQAKDMTSQQFLALHTPSNPVQPIVPPAAAVANAIYHAIGVRMTELPMSPGRA